MDSWTISSAELMEVVLNHPNITQEEIGAKLGIKQNSVSGRWNRTHGIELMEIEKVYRKKIKKTDPMIILLKLLLAHLIGDFFAPTKIVGYRKGKEKKVKSPKIYLHFLIHGALVVILLGIEFWDLALCLMLIHGLIDLIKLYFQKSNNRVFWFFLQIKLPISPQS